MHEEPAKEGHPMEWFIAGLNLLGMTDTGDYKRTHSTQWLVSLQLCGIRCALVGVMSLSLSELGLVENFVQMMGVPGGDTEALTSLLRTFYIYIWTTVAVTCLPSVVKRLLRFG